MRIGVIGSGRMGRILAQRMAASHEVVLYDQDPAAATAVAAALGICAAGSLAELAAAALVLAVPDSAVAGCLDALRQGGTATPVFSIATNISRETLAELDRGAGRCLNVKIVGHAGEMSRGARPLLVVDDIGGELGELALAVFAPVGEVIRGEADQVKTVNRLATEAALQAGVALEKALRQAGVTDGRLISAALSQVGPGVLRAYGEADLGPFARAIVAALRDKSDGE